MTSKEHEKERHGVFQRGESRPEPTRAPAREEKEADAPKKRKPAKLSDPEIQVIAGQVIEAWEHGAPETWVDSQGGVWRFQPVRDEASHIDVTRELAGEPAGATYVSAADFGMESVRTVIASRILAVTEA
jgi:hypothetical protein